MLGKIGTNSSLQEIESYIEEEPKRALVEIRNAINRKTQFFKA